MAYGLSGTGCKLIEVVKQLKDVPKDNFLLEVENPILLEVPFEGELPVELGGDEGDPLSTVKIKVTAVGGMRRTKNMQDARVFHVQAAEGAPATLGRSDDCTVVLDSEGVSRNHAQIHYGGGQYFLVDLQSHNGSYVNKQKAPANEKIALDDRCQLWFGSFRTVFMSPEHFYDLAATLAGRADS